MLEHGEAVAVAVEVCGINVGLVGGPTIAHFVKVVYRQARRAP